MQMARSQCDMTLPLLQMRHTSLLTIVLYITQQFPVAFFCWFISVDKVISGVVQQSFEFHERKASCGFFNISESNNHRLFQTHSKPTVFMKEAIKNQRFCEWLFELVLRIAVIYQNWFFEFLKTIVMNPKSQPEYHQGFVPVFVNSPTMVIYQNKISIQQMLIHICFCLQKGSQKKFPSLERIRKRGRIDFKPSSRIQRTQGTSKKPQRKYSPL